MGFYRGEHYLETHARHKNQAIGSWFSCGLPGTDGEAEGLVAVLTRKTALWLVKEVRQDQLSGILTSILDQFPGVRSSDGQANVENGTTIGAG